MSSSGIFNTVHRAFQYFGIYLIIAGPLLGLMLYEKRSEVIELKARKIDSFQRLERPPGMDHIPINDDPQYAEFPVDTALISIFEYAYENESYIDTLISYYNDQWKGISETTIYIHNIDPESAYYNGPPDGDMAPIAIGLMTLVAGSLLVGVAFYVRRGRQKNHEQLVRTLANIGLTRVDTSGFAGRNDLLMECKVHGKYFIGGIMSAIGMGIIYLMLNEVIQDGMVSFHVVSLMFFPLGLGVIVLIIGLYDFYQLKISIYPNRIVKKRIGAPFPTTKEIPMSEFIGIGEQEIVVKRSASRDYFTEFGLVHAHSPDKVVFLSLMPHSKATREYKKSLCQKLGLPMIVRQGNSYNYEYFGIV